MTKEAVKNHFERLELMLDSLINLRHIKKLNRYSLITMKNECLVGDKDEKNFSNILLN